jgi:SNF2 family DNA or RNA helicase
MQEVDEWEGLDHFVFSLIRGTPKAREKALNWGNTHLINYELLPWLTTKVDLSKTYDAIIFDELSMMKNASSKRFKAVRRHIDKIPICVGLTGTPTGNTLLGVWPQIYCVAGTKNPLGKTYTVYKSDYFYQGGFNNREWLERPDTHQRILNDVRSVAYSFEQTKEYCPLQFSPLNVGLTNELRPMYNELKEEFILFLQDNTVAALNGGALVQKLRQFESGFLYGEAETVTLHSQKIESAIDLVEELNGDPLIIFYEFIHEKELLLKEFSKADQISVDEWNTGKHPVMVLHPRSAGHGLNLQKGGCNLLFYSAPWSLELWQQAIGRVYRTGQNRSVTVYHFQGFPVEDRVVRSLRKHEKIENDTFKGLT